MICQTRDIGVVLVLIQNDLDPRLSATAERIQDKYLWSINYVISSQGIGPTLHTVFVTVQTHTRCFSFQSEISVI